MNLLLGLPLGIFRLLGGFLMLALRLLPLILLAAVAVWVLRRRKKRGSDAQETVSPEPEESSGPSFTGPVVTVDYRDVKDEDTGPQPERPASFGHKTGWMAVRSRDPELVADALGLTDRKRANWTGGLAAVSANRWFVSPSLGGWVVVVGAGERAITPERFSRISRRFSEAQAFVSDRERSAYAWALFRGGNCIRAYGISHGQVILDQGELTGEEIALGFGRFPRKDGGSREGFPDTDAVLSIAAAWGLDPMLEGRQDPPDLGWLCTAE